MKNNGEPSILIFLPNLLVGGAEETILNLIEYLKKMNFKVTLVIATNKISNFYQIPEDIEYINLNSKRLILSFRKAFKTIKFINPDIVFSTLWYSNLLIIIVCKILNKKCIVREAGLDYRSGKNFTSYLYKLLASFLYKRANKIIAISNSLKTNLQNELGIKESDIVTIYNPVENYFNREKLEQYNLGNYFNDTTEDTVFAVSAIRFDKIKFSYNLFLAIKQIHDFDIRLLLIGDGSEKSQIKNFITHNKIENKIGILDWTNKIYSYINSCDLYISSSKFEGLGNAYLAAHLLNKKCLSSNIPASNEINRLFNNGDSFNDEVGDVMSKIEKVISQPELTGKIPKEIIKMFSEDKCFGKYQEIFSMVIK